mgnify:CR=1 FL=1
MHQDLGLVEAVSTVENLALGFGYATAPGGRIKWREETKRAKQLLLDLGFDINVRAPVAMLGAAERTGVAIARALMMKPEVLLFDEPTAALDPEITNQVVKIINDLSETGITQVVVTHEVDFAKKIASHVLYLERGHIVEHGTHDAFVNPQTTQFADYLNH